MTLHVVVGAGPVGWTTALYLADAGEDVRVITRDGGGPVHPSVQLLRADASDPNALRQAAAGAAVLYNAASPPYHRWMSDWPPLAASVLSTAEAVGAVLVTVSNLYGYGPPRLPLLETDPLDSTTAKGCVRARVWQDAFAAHEAGSVRATEVRSSDYFGPRVCMSQFGERIIPRVLAGKTVSVIGDPDVPHSWTYIDDVARTLIVVGADERAWGRAWHTPTNAPLSQRQLISSLGTTAHVKAVKVRRLPPFAMRALGVFVPDIRELGEIRYQFDAPFVVDSEAARAAFGLTPTPMYEALTDTIAWYRRRSTSKDDAHGDRTPPAADTARRAWSRRVLRVGGIIQACFAAFWLVRGGLALGGGLGVALAVGFGAVALVALGYGVRATAGLAPRPVGEEATRLERAVTVATVIELVAAFVFPAIVIAAGRSDLTLPSIAITIGPLLLWLDHRLGIPRYRPVGWALAVGPILLALVLSGSALAATTGLAAGALLLFTATAGFRELADGPAVNDFEQQRGLETGRSGA